jgi:DnaK suppressor protein
MATKKTAKSRTVAKKAAKAKPASRKPASPARSSKPSVKSKASTSKKQSPAKAPAKKASVKKPVTKASAKPKAGKAVQPKAKAVKAKPAAPAKAAAKAKPRAGKAPVAKTRSQAGKSGTTKPRNGTPGSKAVVQPKAVSKAGGSPQRKPAQAESTKSSQPVSPKTRRMSSKAAGTDVPTRPSSPATPARKPAKPVTTTISGEGKGFIPYELKKGEEYMNEKQKEHFKRILLDWRNELMQEVDRTVHHMQDEAANPPDPADRATLEEEFSIELRTRDRERRLIKKIDSTIELIANDEYGYCDSCGVEIGIRRLEARPTANKCIDCKTLDEIKEKQLGSA